MFQNLMDLSYKRTKLQAVGFYFAFLILIMLLGGTIAGIYSISSHLPKPQTIANCKIIGAYTALIMIPFLTIAVFCAKRLFKSYLSYIVILLSIIFTAVGGGLFGMIPTAILTLFEKQQ